MKNSNETIVNRTRDLLACSTVPRPTAPPRASTLCTTVINIQDCMFYRQSAFMCFVRVSGLTANIFLYKINLLAFITKAECVY
jgi:hypothetical protein